MSFRDYVVKYIFLNTKHVLILKALISVLGLT